jgi:hypothetical protein
LADADIGRVKPASEVFDAIEAKLKAKTKGPSAKTHR